MAFAFTTSLIFSDFSSFSVSFPGEINLLLSKSLFFRLIGDRLLAVGRPPNTGLFCGKAGTNSSRTWWKMFRSLTMWLRNASESCAKFLSENISHREDVSSGVISTGFRVSTERPVELSGELYCCNWFSKETINIRKLFLCEPVNMYIKIHCTCCQRNG